MAPVARALADLEAVGAAGVGEQADAVRRGRALREEAGAVGVVAAAVEQHAESQVEAHALADAERDMVGVVARFIAQDADRLVHAVALRIARGPVSIVAALVPQDADPAVIADPLGEELRLVAMVAALVA